MPELPEVETVKRGLNGLIVGKLIKSIDHDWLKSFPNNPNDVDNFVVGAEIVNVERRGKALILGLNSEYSFIIHLKMTGQLVYRGEQNFGAGHPNNSLVGSLPDKSTRVIFSFSDGSKLFFNDQRKFGWVKLIPTSQVNNHEFIKKLGPEPLSKNFTKTEFLARIHKRQNTTIKAVLLDQTILAGVGNIYADESLWGAKIFPGELVKSINKSRLETLYDEMLFVLKLSIEKGGSTDKNYVDAEGKKGSYLQFAKVFRREGKLCPRCSAIIKKTRVAGRGTHYCPVCQKNKIKR
ncbi:bifunctional DNA-formamidopyrimidine glycosylase/DNA-(apurinic or apyrimidinic site) lyase [Candidatus Saccharibacteria bacterium]|nr:bifunctional DNA-formamidopyrimidine glycosylase/DNA-(apurinic or apyrimidinic site) lyase [Candidatus Saccharibacteria bacterium]